MPICLRCTNPVAKRRYDLGIRLCLDCGERESKRITRTIVPSHKGAYQPVNDVKYLKMLNKYAAMEG